MSQYLIQNSINISYTLTTMEETQKFELEAILEELEGYRGRHTELITVYIPAGATMTSRI